MVPGTNLSQQVCDKFKPGPFLSPDKFVPGTILSGNALHELGAGEPVHVTARRADERHRRVARPLEAYERARTPIKQRGALEEAFAAAVRTCHRMTGDLVALPGFIAVQRLGKLRKEPHGTPFFRRRAVVPLIPDAGIPETSS